jgi:ferritin-like metal-binding protein YciE
LNPPPEGKASSRNIINEKSFMAKQPTNSGKQSPARARKSKESESESMENPLHEVFLEEVADIYNAEQQILKALPRMAKAAQSEELREAFEEHQSETEQQVQRLEEAMATLDESMKRKKCKGMEGLIAEGEEMMKEQKGKAALDAVLIASAQKIEHYEIAAYGTLCAWAEQMGHSEALEFFQETLEEEKAADEKLTEIAESIANLEAEEEDE